MNATDVARFSSNVKEAIEDLKTMIDQLERINRIVRVTDVKEELVEKLENPHNSICMRVDGLPVISPMSLRRAAEQIRLFVNSSKEYEPMEIS